jgi:predicted PolB exonuclease-like 3'-5' exonuclease
MGENLAAKLCLLLGEQASNGKQVSTFFRSFGKNKKKIIFCRCKLICSEFKFIYRLCLMHY